MAQTDEVEVRVDGGLAGTQTVEIEVAAAGAEALADALESSDISYEQLDKRPPDLTDGTVLSVGSFHLGEGGAGLAGALQSFEQTIQPAEAALSIAGTVYDVTETDAVSAALVGLRRAQDGDDAAADEARALWQREYELEQGAEDSEEPK